MTRASSAITPGAGDHCGPTGAGAAGTAPTGQDVPDTVGNLRLASFGPRRYAMFPRLAQQAGLRHAFATRPLDVSARLDDRRQEREARRRQMAADLGFDPRRLWHCVQVHGGQLAVVDGEAEGGPLEGCDGAITRRRDAALMTFSADCPLVLLYDPLAAALGLVHASWRCTVASLVGEALRLMQLRFGCRPERMLAGVGPSAGPAMYEVGRDVYDAAAGLAGRERYFPRDGARMCFDLWEANRAQLLAGGVREENVELAAVCTMTRTDLFYSYRREGAGCGHFGLLAGLTPEQAEHGGRDG
ncbi:MAG TPA: polyphenol oxidase family protein [Phycisphaerae bacterium]|nr:polyphenol oxidase family protein [Phycisphaerae bacterium]